MFRVNKDIVSSGKGKEVYAKKGDLVDVFITNGDLVMCDHIKGDNRLHKEFYCKKIDLDKM